MQIERGLVKARLGTIHYRSAGAGPPVMLFHINQQSSALMRELMECLAPSFRAIAMDYPSHGHSDPIDFHPSFDDYSECAIAVMDALGVAKASVMGEAVGAGVAWALVSEKGTEQTIRGVPAAPSEHQGVPRPCDHHHPRQSEHSHSRTLESI